MTESPLSQEVACVVSQNPNLWNELSGARIFITGGTGFFGKWLLESFISANRGIKLGAHMTVLTRDEEGFRLKYPPLTDAPEISFHQGDVRDFDFPRGSFTHVIHAATEASATLNRENPKLMKDVIVLGTQRALEFSARCGAQKFLLTSSGAVYGRQRPDISHIDEEDPGFFSPLDPPLAYAEGKREAERLCVSWNGSLQIKIARGFAFVGPYLPLDTHFAIGNFIRDALSGGPIEIKGDGTPYRSYLYGADLAVWLWTILLKGKPLRPYNVGSERRVSIRELAQIVAKTISPKTEVRVAQKPEIGKTPEQYVPSTQRAQKELGLSETVSLEDAIRRTADSFSWEESKEKRRG